MGGCRRLFRNQNYKQLKKECARKDILFVDPEFPPTGTSLFLDPEKSHAEILWKRPGDLVEDPKLFVEGASPNDVAQGILGNCWFVSACSALTHNQKLLDKVVPDARGQEWMPGARYSGIFRFCFWRFDSWIEVVVDDLLPTRHGKLLFARSKTPNEFWSALLEKAFAKLYGCYENLIGGQLADALQDVSGGVAETISIIKFLDGDLSDSDSQLFRTLKNALDRKALVIAAIAAKNKEEIEEALDCGLVKGHAYAVTAVRLIELDAKEPARVPSYLSLPLLHPAEHQKMIRLQNPWGEKEWNGPWSDGSVEWLQVTDARKQAIGITVDEDGEFWMPWNEFLRYFTDLSVCDLFEDTSKFSRFSFRREYYEWKFWGEWKTNGKSGSPSDRAGGCLNFLATFCSNPQYIFDIVEDNGDVMLALSQREKNEGEKKREPHVTIGIHVMKVENNRKYRIHQPTVSVATSDYASARSVFLHLKNLCKGRYVALPTTFAPREQAEYLFRIYSERNCCPRQLETHMPSRGSCSCNRIACVTRITLVGAKFLTGKVLKVYCVLANDEESIRSSTLEGDSIYWNETYLFYQKTLKYGYKVEAYEKRMLKDRLVGKARIREVVDNDSRTVDLALMDGHGKRSGTVSLVFQSYDDPVYL